MYVSMYAPVYRCICTYKYVYVYVYEYVLYILYVGMHTYMRVCVCVHECMQVDVSGMFSAICSEKRDRYVNQEAGR